MAGSTSVQVRIISNRLPQVPAQVRALLSQEVSKAAFEIEARSKALAPVKTGLLRRSIHTVMAANGQSATVGPSVEYGKFVEFGTRRMGARPYMRPAAEQELPKFVDAVKRALAGLT
jgi:HK97 gp10 family phage protein